MSDPVSNIEIEDVLSSIRRLVSEETGSQPRPEPVRQPPEENRLVLTPSLRVLDDSAETLTSIDEAEDLHQTDDGTPWNDPDATLYKAAQIEPDAVSESENGDNAVSEPETGDNAGDDPFFMAEYADEDTPVAPVSDTDNQGRATLSDVFVMVNEAHQIDGDSMPEDESDWSGDDASDLENELQDDDPQLPGEPDDHENVSSENLDLDDLTPLSDKIAALETAIGETQDQWEPDGAAGDDYAGTPVRTLQWQDHEVEDPVSVGAGEFGGETTQEIPHAAEIDGDTTQEIPHSAEIDGDTAQEIPHAAEQGFDTDGEDATELDFLVGDDSIMDEESLRELVADIVREELQGALGERITRNVRKLVRREIHRALTTQQLD